MGLILLELSDMMAMTDRNDFVVFFLFKFLYPILFYFLFNKLKILEFHSFFIQIAQFS